MDLNLKTRGFLKEISGELSSFLKPYILEDISHLLERPRSGAHGHLALPLFTLAKKHKTSPGDLAKQLEQKIGKDLPPFLEDCQAVSSFLNFKFSSSFLSKKLESIDLKEILKPCFEEKEHWLIDFASPNVAKHMNVGHLRASVLGQALVNLCRAMGVKVLALNHLGDFGSQFGKLLLAYKKWGSEMDFEKNPLSSMVELYVRFHKELEGDEKALEEARELFKKLEEGDKELKKLWKRFVDLSLKDYEKTWKILNVSHDKVIGESFYSSKTPDLRKKLEKKDLLQKSEGAEVVFLKGKKPPCLIFKSDGASTYAARDLCSLIYRFEELKVSKNFYVTGSDQKLHFEQIFEVASLLDKKWGEESLHLHFGMYRFKGEGKMSSRKGQAVFLKDILEEARSKVRSIIEERNPDLKDKEKVSLQVASGALIFNDLISDRIKDVDFNWDKVLDFEGGSGPFVQYSLVRIKSLLKKYKDKIPKKFSSSLKEESEKELLWHLLLFRDVCEQALKEFKPHILARWLLELAKLFNRFYASGKILGSEKEKDLIFLSFITGKFLEKALEILGLEKPEAM